MEDSEANPVPSTGSGFWSTLFTLISFVLVVLLVVWLYRCIRVQMLKRRRDNLLKSGNQSVESAVNDVELKYASFGTAT